MKCEYCGAELLFEKAACFKCFFALPYDSPTVMTHYQPTATKNMMEYPVEYPATFLNFPGDRVLAKIGRAFDDAIDLAYLG